MGILDRFIPKRVSWSYYAPHYGVQVCNLDTAALYRTQPNLRAVVSYLADNAAQVPLKVHKRVSNDDRPRVLDSPAALLLQHPNEDMTAFEMKRAIYSDLYLYGMCLVIVVPDASTKSGWQMRHVPATWIVRYRGTDPFAPEAVIIRNPYGHAAGLEVPSSRFVIFHGYDPSDPMAGCSPVQALKDVLHEQVESNVFRRQMWQRGGRFNAYVKRPKDVAKWTDEAFDRFRDTFRNSWAGDFAAEGGGMPILEDGMEIAQLQFNSRDAQWSEAKKLGREDVAGVYHVNPALIWPGSGQTYASAKDNARALYNETLAPMMMQVCDRLNQFLLPMVHEPELDYVAYDITIKTAGSFEEQVQALQTATGAPILTRNEARARLDLPALDGGDELVVPMNVLAGGLASPYDTDPTVVRYGGVPQLKSASYKASPDEEEQLEMAEAYRAFFRHQRNSLLPKLGAEKKRGNIKAADWWDETRWNRELTEALYPVALRQASKAAHGALAELDVDDYYSEERTEAYVRKMAESRARMANAKTYDALMGVDDWDGEEDAERATYAGVFDLAEGDRAESMGAAFATAAMAWGVLEAVRQCAPNEGVMKTWIVNSSNPRPSHAQMDGETVPYDEEFSNGSMRPGDEALDAADVANCQCTIEVTIH